jgi:GGDEF domain-containing protein
VALSPQDAATAEGLQKAADRALYRAKSLGRNRVFAASGLEPAARAA